MANNPRISVVTPAHKINQTDYFLDRIKHSLSQQTFRNFEWIVTWEGNMPINSNSAIKKAKGDIIKILYMDDFLWTTNALQHVADAFEKGIGWYASGCVHTEDGVSFRNPHVPSYNEHIQFGENTIGSPSVVAFENDDPLLFDEELSWLLDCDLYVRLYKRYGAPILNKGLDIAIGIGTHQMSNILTPHEKFREHEYLKEKYK